MALFIGNYASLEVMSDSLLTAILVWLSRCFTQKGTWMRLPGRALAMLIRLGLVIICGVRVISSRP